VRARARARACQVTVLFVIFKIYVFQKI